MTAETLISNAVSTTTFAVNAAATKLFASLTAYTESEAAKEYNKQIGKQPIKTVLTPREHSYGSGLGAIAAAVDDSPTVWDYVTDEGDGELSAELRDLSLEARDNIKDINDDFLAKAEALLGDLTGATDLVVDVSVLSSLQYNFVTQTFETFSREYAAAQHEEMRERRKLMSELAAQGHTYLPGHAADLFNEQRLATAAKVTDLVRTTYRQRAKNRLDEFEARTNTLLSVLGELTDARIRALLAAKQYAVSVAKGVEFAIDKTYYEKLRSMQYNDLALKGFNEDTKIKADLMGAFNNVLQVQSRADGIVREYKDYTLGKVPEEAESDYSEAFINAQKETVSAAIDALMWLGKIAAAAEAAANVVVSSSVTAFE